MDRRSFIPNTWLTLVGMALGVLLIYRTVSLPLIALGLLLYGGLALLRPSLALLFIPIVAPWYLSPVYVPDIRAEGTVFPLAEVLVLVVAAAGIGRSVIGSLIDREQVVAVAERIEPTASRLLPQALLLLASALGVLFAVERAPALRELRWMIIEPLLFFSMMRWFQWRNPNYTWQMATSFVLSGVIVALFGLFQAFGIDLVPVLLSPTKSFSDSVVETGNVARVASVYGHPNNLGMYLGRAWPIAAALALAAWRWKAPRWWAWLAAAATLLCLAGLGISFSRGAWLGAGAAVAVFLLGAESRMPIVAGEPRILGMRRGAAIALGLALAVVSGAVLSLRGGIGGGSTDVRLLFWQESLHLIERYPFGLGLDQFYYYHNPDFGRSMIDLSLIGTSEQYAKHPHNGIFELWLLLTPFGLVAFGWLLVRFFSAVTRRLRGREPQAWLCLGACAAMVAAIIHGMFDTFYFWPDIAFAFWLLLNLGNPPQSPSAQEA